MSLPDDVKVEFSKAAFDKLTLGELEELESIVGPDALERMMAGKIGGKAMVALAWIALRKDHPDVTLDEVRKLKLSVITPSEDEANPTDASA